MSVGKRIRDARKAAGMTLDELAAKAEISKTYLWELEKDEAGEKKPSADILLKIANALSTTIGQLLGLPTVKADTREIELPSTLLQLRERLEKLGTNLTESELKELALIRFRGGQPKTVDEWHQLYLILASTAKRKQ